MCSCRSSTFRFTTISITPARPGLTTTCGRSLTILSSSAGPWMLSHSLTTMSKLFVLELVIDLVLTFSQHGKLLYISLFLRKL